MLGPKAIGTHIMRRLFGINGALPWSNKAKVGSASLIPYAEKPNLIFKTSKGKPPRRRLSNWTDRKRN